MKLEKRAQSASEETAAQIPAAPAAENGRHKPVLLYLVILFAIACGVSFMLSGYYGLYSSQKIMYSKLRAEYINIHAK